MLGSQQGWSEEEGEEKGPTPPPKRSGNFENCSITSVVATTKTRIAAVNMRGDGQDTKGPSEPSNKEAAGVGGDDETRRGGNNSSQQPRKLPLKTILQNFLNHVESLEARKREGDDAYEKEFQVRASGVRRVN